MTKDMTTGSPMKLLLGFIIPTLFGFLFQQCYNIVDTVIVGRFLGVNALAAVGATGSINFLIIGFCVGVCSGFAIPIAQKFGAGDHVGLRKYVANCTWLSIAFALIMTVLTTIFCRQILIKMKTPMDILEGAHSYIWVIFLGIPAIFLYNMVSGIIRSLGDSKTPVYFLLLSSVTNILLDLFFIVVLKWGIAGAAWATVISQGSAGVLCLFYMIKKFEILHVKGEEWRPDIHMMAVLCGMGVPMGLQYSITAIGSVILQTATNTLGSMYVASTTAAGRIGGFLACPLDAMGAAMATYGGQNVGAAKLDRIGKGLKDCIILGISYSVIAFLIAFFFGRPLATLFVDSSEAMILDNVRLYLVIITAAYFLLAFVNIVRFLIQGIGFPTFAILAGVLEMIARAITGIWLVPALGYTGAALGSPIAWIMADAFLIPAYFMVMKKLRRKLAMTQ